MPITEAATIFSFGPMKVRLPRSDFNAQIVVDATAGQPPHRTVRGEIRGDWEVQFGGSPLVFFRETSLTYDADSGVNFNISPSHVELTGVMQFVSEMLSSIGRPGSGLTLGLLPEGGVQALLNLPIPDIQGATFGISNLNLQALMALRIRDEVLAETANGKQGQKPFSIALGFSLGRQDAPFALTIFILGGGGYIDLGEICSVHSAAPLCRGHRHYRECELGYLARPNQGRSVCILWSYSRLPI